MNRKLLVIGVLVAIAAITAALVLPGMPERRMRAAMVEAGLDEETSSCLAGELADRLSFGQLWELRSLSVFRDRQPDDLTIREFVGATRGLRDRHVWISAGRSGAACAIRNRRLGPLSIGR